MLESASDEPGTLALALSGGGSRAIAFHLGCLRALHNAGLLSQVSVISSVSGGSVLAALYCQTAGDFDAFEAKVRGVLARGLVRPALWKAVSSAEGILACFNAIAIALERTLAFAVLRVLRILPVETLAAEQWIGRSRIPRRASRTTILRRVFSDLFDQARLPSLRKDRPSLIIVACELQTKSAFYFSAEEVSSWRFGQASPETFEIADAVSASAAYPMALPALDLQVEFSRRDGSASTHRVILTDGGVYDNLGLAPLWPDRDRTFSFLVGRYPRIICCRAGYALEAAAAPAFAPSRVIASFESVFARSQNLAINRLFDLKKQGVLKAVLHPYLGQNDGALPGQLADDFVTREASAGYPTNFSAMPAQWIDKLVRRGEQLTTALIVQHGVDLEHDPSNLA